VAAGAGAAAGAGGATGVTAGFSAFGFTTLSRKYMAAEVFSLNRAMSLTALSPFERPSGDR